MTHVNKILHLTIYNPEEEFITKNSYTCEDILNEHINELIIQIQPKEMYDELIINKLKEKYNSNSIIRLQIQDVNLFQSFKKMENKLSEYEKIILIAVPDLSSSIFIIYSNHLKHKLQVPFLYCISDYIDFLYCLYSYLLI